MPRVSSNIKTVYIIDVNFFLWPVYIEMQSLLSSPKHHTHLAAFFTHSKNKRKLRDEIIYPKEIK